MTVKKKATKKRAKGLSRRCKVQRQKAFLSSYSQFQNICAACEAAGVDRSQHYRWMKDPEYKVQFDKAHEDAADRLEREALRRAMDGERKLVLHNGEPVKIEGEYLYETKRSDTLTIFLLKAMRPDKFRERQSIEMGGPGGGPINVNHSASDLAGMMGDPEIAAAIEKVANRSAALASQSSDDQS